MTPELHKTCTKDARWLHGQRASFFIFFFRKEGETMYDNDWIFLILDDDLFVIDEDDVD